MALKNIFSTIILSFIACTTNCCQKGGIDIVERKNVMNNTEYMVTVSGRFAQTVYISRCYTDGDGKERMNLKIVPNYDMIFSNNLKERFVILSYTEQIHTLDIILRNILNNSDLSKLYCLQIDLSAWGVESCNITAEYIKKYSDGSDINDGGLRQTFMGSRLMKDLKAKLKQYDLTIKRIEMEMPFFIDDKGFSAYNVVDTGMPIPKKIVRATMYLILN